MSNLSVFSFNSKQVRTVTDSRDGSVWFVLKDVLEAMGSTTRPAIARSSIEEAFEAGYIKTTHLDTGFGVKETTIINEPAVTFLVSRSNTEAGKKLNRWIHTEVLPSIRKTGNYSAQPASGALEDKVRAAGEIAKMLNLTGSSLSGALRRTVAKLDADLLPMFPEYSIDAPIVAGQAPAESSEATLSLTELLKRNGSPIGAVKANKILIQLGILEEKMRPSRKGEQRKFKCITQKGLQYGKNVVTEQSPLETQPHWFECQFSDLLALMLGAQEKKAA